MAQQLASFQPLSPLDSLLEREQTQRGELQFLTFPLGGNTAAMLPVSQLAEVLTLAYSQIMPIPDLPRWALGVTNWRGEMLWVVDLAGLAGLPTLHQQMVGTSNCKVIVTKVQVETQLVYLGLAVQDVEEMYWCPAAAIISPPTTAITPGLAPFLAGYTLGNTGQMLMALDAAAITERVGLLTD
jgi:positive phototaxis protein PixI